MAGNYAARRKAARTTRAQYELMVDFISKNVDMIEGKLTFSFTAEKKEKLWADLAKLLNSSAAEGEEKTTTQWRKTWTDLKSQVKRKSLSAYKEQLRSGEETSTGCYLSALEKRVASLIGTYPIAADDEVRERFKIEQTTTPEENTESALLIQVKSEIEDLEAEKGESSSSFAEPSTSNFEWSVEENNTTVPTNSTEKANTENSSPSQQRGCKRQAEDDDDLKDLINSQNNLAKALNSVAVAISMGNAQRIKIKKERDAQRVEIEKELNAQHLEIERERNSMLRAFLQVYTQVNGYSIK